MNDEPSTPKYPVKETLYILGKPYLVNYIGEAASGGNLGSANRSLQVINVNVDVGHAQIEDTLLHEVLHVIDGELKIGLSEEDVARLAVGLYSAGYRRIPA